MTNITAFNSVVNISNQNMTPGLQPSSKRQCTEDLRPSNSENCNNNLLLQNLATAAEAEFSSLTKIESLENRLRDLEQANTDLERKIKALKRELLYWNNPKNLLSMH